MLGLTSFRTFHPAISLLNSTTVVEVAGTHAVYVSKPQAVAALIEKAANGVKIAAN